MDLAGWVGCYRLVVSEELIDFVEHAIVAKAPDAERARVRAEALAEAGAARLEIDGEGNVTSRAGEQAFFRVPLRKGASDDSVTFDKPGAVVVTLRRDSADRLVASQPEKPDTVFTRVE